ncbi:MAG: aminotransferase class IV [Acidobacteriota bacterium]|nr:aminotransferase class IV [Acidobacteriota bacterium]
MTDVPERVAYFNGEIVPESGVLIPLRDAGFLYGYAAFDTERTFAHHLYRLDEHLERFYRSLRYLDLDPGMEPAEMERLTHEVVERNVPLLGPDDDYWVTQRVTLGQSGPEGWKSTVIIECKPLPLAERAACFRDGIDLIVSSLRRTPPEAQSPRAKTHNYINLILADREVKAQNPDAWSILLDMDGHLCEGVGSNLFLVRDRLLLTPRERLVLPGVSRSAVFQLAAACGLEAVEADLDVYDAQTADEAFLSSTSLCMCPVRSLNGRPIGDGSIPGPISRMLMDAWIEELGGFDFVGQYLKRLVPSQLSASARD